MDAQEAWFVTCRWQAFDGEHRSNRLRVLSVLPFYVVHLLQVHRPLGLMASDDVPNSSFHLAVTLIVAAWFAMALAVEVVLRQRWFPGWMGLATTTIDVLLLTGLLSLGGGQQSPLVYGYFVILVLAALRFDLSLIRLTTLGIAFSYGWLLFMGRFPDWFGGHTIGTVPRYAQVMTLLAILITGVLLGQLVRRIRVMADYFASRRQPTSEVDPSASTVQGDS